MMLSLSFPAASAGLLAQQVPMTDTTHAIRGVEVSAGRKDKILPGVSTRAIDSLALAMSADLDLAQLLPRRTGAYVKEFGAGNLASLSLHGMSAVQTSLCWNGFDLNAPGAGMTDLSLIPLSFFDELAVSHTGSGPRGGSGKPGGSVNLGTGRLAGRKGTYRAGLTAGSFGEFRQHAQAVYGGARAAGRTAFMHAAARNDFPFSYQGEKFSRERAGFDQTALIQSFEYLGKRQEFHSGLWLQQTAREIPSPSNGADLLSERDDRSLRFTNLWNINGHRWSLNSGTGLFYDFLRYRESSGDTLVLLDSRIRNLSVPLFAGVKGTHDRSGTSWEAGGSATYSTIDINDFGGFNEQVSGALRLSLLRPVFGRDWRAALSVEQQFSGGYHVPPGFYVGLEGDVFPFLSLAAGFSRTLRIPAMNDRYWQPGGNGDLQPECSDHVEAGITWNPLRGKMNLSYSVQAFASSVRDWITWIPGTTGTWQAVNVAGARIRGLETEQAIRMHLAGLLIEIPAFVTWVSAVSAEKTSPLDRSEGKQFIYTPELRAGTGFRLRYKSWAMESGYSHTGRVYTVRDHSASLPPVSLVDLTLRYTWMTSGTLSADLQASVRNLTGRQYENVAFYPMPGRSFSFSLVCRINKTPHE